MAQPDVEKAAFRTHARNQRVAISKEQRKVASELACKHLMRSNLWASISSIALYAAYGSEIDPLPLEQEATSSGKRIFYPRVTGDKLEFAESNYSDLTKGFAAIFEPTGPPVALRDIDLVIVPGLAFGPQGQRLGSGRGFYDRSLNGDVLTIGMAFHQQISSQVPTLPHDVRMQGILTDKGFTLEPSIKADSGLHSE
ncbi:MAG: 5-formyltetrahydrofolate cyclo-ligase [Myxococcota bacterium]|nr:5-formyltetrahydrofolate cyclo-ligase [Myxococcota bacterium]